MSQECEKCKVSVFETPLHRVNSFGQTGVFWCEKCIKKYEPELYKNIKDDETEVDKTLRKIIYNK